MNTVSSWLRHKSSFVAVLAILTSIAVLPFGSVYPSYAQAPTRPYASVFEINPTTGDIPQISLHAPGSVANAFVIPHGRYVTPNGLYAMAMPALGAYQVIDLQTGLQIAGWPSSAGHNMPTSMAVSPNGTYAAVSSISTVDSLTWTVDVFNLHANTRYSFSYRPNISAPDPSIPLQLQPTIEGWTGDELSLILSTGIPASGAPFRLIFKIAMAAIPFSTLGTTGPVPASTQLATTQQILKLVFSPDSNQAVFGYGDPTNSPINYVPLTAGPGAGLPPNTLTVLDLNANTTQTIARAASGQGLTAPAWAPDGSKIYFGAGPYQNTAFPINVHLQTYDVAGRALTSGGSLATGDSAHQGVSDMELCTDQLFIRQVSVAADGVSLQGNIVSTPLTNLTPETLVRTAQGNALGPCTPALNGSSDASGVVPSIPTLVGPVTALPIVCALTPRLILGGQGIVTPGQPNNLRVLPTVGSARITQIPVSGIFSVLDGPYCDTTSGYVYWHVNYNGSIGYTTEGRSGVYLVDPYVASAPTFTPSPVPIVGPTVIPGTCISGYVWREANPSDHVCVTPDVRSQAAADNAAAGSRIVPVGTCIQGYVWREASPSDHVCVTPDVRSQAAADNAVAGSRKDPGGAYGPNTCVSGYVWREAFTNDLVCVTGAVRSQAAADNAAAASRVVPAGTCIQGYVWREAFTNDLVCVTPAVRSQAAADNAAAASRVAH